MQRNLTLSKVLELALALGGLVWIAIQVIPALDLKPGSGLLGFYGVEAIALSLAIVGSLLLEFPHGEPHLRALWFCLGMATAMTALAVLYFELFAVLSVAPAWAAAVTATVRVRGNWDRLLRWFWAGVGAQIALMILLVVGFILAMTMARTGGTIPPPPSSPPWPPPIPRP